MAFLKTLSEHFDVRAAQARADISNCLVDIVVLVLIPIFVLCFGNWHLCHSHAQHGFSISLDPIASRRAKRCHIKKKKKKTVNSLTSENEADDVREIQFSIGSRWECPAKWTNRWRRTERKTKKRKSKRAESNPKFLIMSSTFPVKYSAKNRIKRMSLDAFWARYVSIFTAASLLVVLCVSTIFPKFFAGIVREMLRSDQQKKWPQIRVQNTQQKCSVWGEIAQMRAQRNRYSQSRRTRQHYAICVGFLRRIQFVFGAGVVRIQIAEGNAERTPHHHRNRMPLLSPRNIDGRPLFASAENRPSWFEAVECVSGAKYECENRRFRFGRTAHHTGRVAVFDMRNGQLFFARNCEENRLRVRSGCVVHRCDYVLIVGGQTTIWRRHHGGAVRANRSVWIRVSQSMLAIMLKYLANIIRAYF